MSFLIAFTLLAAPAKTEYVPELNLSLAKKIAEKAQGYGEKKGWKLSIAIVNTEGNLLYFQRDEASYVGSVQASQDKAKSSNAFQRPTSAFVDGVKQGRNGLLSVPGIVALEGGVPIVIKGKHVGSVGISGARSTEDEEAANFAVKDIEKL